MASSEPITRERMLPIIIEADPTFEPVFLAWKADWEGDPDWPQYLALAEFARHLVAQLDRGETARFPAIFDVIERWHVEGDKYVREAATVGLLEDLQNTNLHTTRTRPDDFLLWLRPESKKFWHKVERFWSHGEIITED